MPCNVNAASDASVAERAAVAALAACLDRRRAGRQSSLAGHEEPGLDHRVRVEHHDCVPVEVAGVLEAGLTRRRPARLLVVAALEHECAERAGDRCGLVGAAVGHHQHAVGGAPVGIDGLEASGDDAFLVVRRHEHQEPELPDA